MLNDIIIFLFEIERKKAKPVVKSAHTGRAQRSVVLVGHLDLVVLAVRKKFLCYKLSLVTLSFFYTFCP